jgi:hypothetical protein
MLPSTGCTTCVHVSDDVLARIARETLARRTSLRLKGFALVSLAFALALFVIAFSVAINAKLVLLALSLVPPVGAVGAQRLESAKLGNHIKRDDVERYERERTNLLEASVGSVVPVGVPAIRIDRA